VLGIIAVLLIAAAVVFFFRPAEPLTPYETVAKTFVETYFRNDLPTMETLVQYDLYSYMEDELDTGKAGTCSATVVKTELCTEDRILDIEMSLSFMGGFDTVTEAYTVTVDYQAVVDGTERNSSNEITVGKIGESWTVVSYRPFEAE
ncbi:MAG: hypothetical protein CW335_03755, partial [Clostridiales bacterium]|nr:hypothetical protein [Clostridiales bacterium]